MKKILLFIIISLSVPLQATSIYKQTYQENFPSIVWQDEEWPIESFAEYLARCYRYQQEMQEYKRRTLTTQIFDAVCPEALTNSCLYDAVTGRDINLLCGSKQGDSYVAQIIDRTDTIFGRMALMSLINNPINDSKQLTDRQLLIKKLIEDEKLYERLRQEVFIPLSKVENILLSFWGQDNFLQASKRCYFSIPFSQRLDSYMNSSSSALAVKSLWGHQGRFLQTSLLCGATILLPIYLLSLAMRVKLPDAVNKLIYRFQGASNPLLAVMACSANAWIAATGTGMTVVDTAVNSKENFDWSVDCVKLENFLQQKMIKCASYIKCLQELLIILKASPEFLELCPSAQHLRVQMQRIMQNVEVKKLIELLFTETFQGDSSIFSHQGRVLVAYRLMHKLKKEFEPLLLYLGEIDAYLSCATLYQEFLNKRVHLCFAEYKESDSPSIDAQNFWNPLINAEIVVPNSLQLGDATRRNMIITGPNAGGKSSLIKGLVINIILTQSIGLAAAEKFTITPFRYIATYLNIIDDIASGNSLFKAQVLRAQEIIFLAETTPKAFFNFIALDEMFNGTSAQESEAASYSVANYLGTFDNSMCVFATHYPQMTLLEKSTDDFANYKVSVMMHPRKGICYPFKLEPGISQQHIALDILQQEGFDNTIIQHALELLYNS